MPSRPCSLNKVQWNEKTDWWWWWGGESSIFCILRNGNVLSFHILRNVKVLLSNSWLKKKSSGKGTGGGQVEAWRGERTAGTIQKDDGSLGYNDHKCKKELWYRFVICWRSKIDGKKKMHCGSVPSSWLKDGLFTPTIYFWFSMLIFSDIAGMLREILALWHGVGQTTLGSQLLWAKRGHRISSPCLAECSAGPGRTSICG